MSMDFGEELVYRTHDRPSRPSLYSKDVRFVGPAIPGVESNALRASRGVHPAQWRLPGGRQLMNTTP